MMTRRKIFEVRVTLPVTADLLALVDDYLSPMNIALILFGTQ